MNKGIDQLAVNNIRTLCISMVEEANSGHPGGPMGGAIGVLRLLIMRK